MNKISAYLVFAEGFASFLSPCLLPLLPVYLGYLSGEITQGKSDKRMLVINSIVFTVGLSLVFILMGITASMIGGLLNKYKNVLTKVAAVIIIIFGLFDMGLIKIGFLYKERRLNIKYRKANLVNSFIFGMAFALGWTPCIGPILGSVLIIAGSSGSTAYGVYLLFIYSLGLSIPFIVTALFMDLIISKLKNIQKYSKQIGYVSGLILIILGAAMYTGWLQKLIL